MAFVRFISKEREEELVAVVREAVSVLNSVVDDAYDSGARDALREAAANPGLLSCISGEAAAKLLKVLADDIDKDIKKKGR